MSVQSLVASITGYTKTDIETIVTLLLVLSLVIGLLTNLPVKNEQMNESVEYFFFIKEEYKPK